MKSKFKKPAKNIICLTAIILFIMMFLPSISFLSLSASAAAADTSGTIISEGIYQIKSASFPRYMQLEGIANGSKVKLAAKSNSDTQQFIVRKSYTGENEYYILPITQLGLSLDIPAGSSGNVDLEVFKHLYYTPLNYSNQVFKIEIIREFEEDDGMPSGCYSIKTKCGTNNCISSQTISTIKQTPFNENLNNYWYFEKVGNVQHDIKEGLYKLKNTQTGKYMEVQNGGTVNQSKLIQANNASHDYQMFYVKAIGSNEYFIIPYHASSKTIDIPNWTQNEVQAEIYTYRGTSNPSNQTFIVDRIDISDNYSIKSKHTAGNPSNRSNSCLSVNTSTNAVIQTAYASSSNLNHWKFEAVKPLEDGVYQLASRENSKLFIDVPYGRIAPTMLWQLELQPPIKDPEKGRPALFKFRNIRDNLYYIYPMVNNEYVLSTNGTNVFSGSSGNFSWRVTRDLNGDIMISPSIGEYTDLYISVQLTEKSTSTQGISGSTVKVPESGSNLVLTDITAIEDTVPLTSSRIAKWIPVQCTEEMEGVTLETRQSHIVASGSSIDLSEIGEALAYWSSNPQKNHCGSATYSVKTLNNATTNIASITSAGLLNTASQKAGCVKVNATFQVGYVYSTNIYIKPPNNNYFFLQNVQGNLGMIQQDSTTASKQGFDYDPEQIWQWEYYQNGWYHIKNLKTGNYLTSPSNGFAGSNMKFETTKSTYNTQLWKKELAPSGSGGYRIQSKYMADNYSSLYLSLNTTTGTLEQGVYINNNSYYDEFNIITMGDEVVYNRTLTRNTNIDPSSFISNLSKYYNSFALLQRDIYMDLNTAKNYLSNSKIMVFNGHGSPSVITIKESPREYINNTDIYNPNSSSSGLELSNTDIVIFAGCSTGGKFCDSKCCSEYDKIGNTEKLHSCDLKGCNCCKDKYNMPRSAIEAGAKVAIGWKVTTYDNHMNDWIDYFFMMMNSTDPNTGRLYTAKEAFDKANNNITIGNANRAILYGNENFRLSD